MDVEQLDGRPTRWRGRRSRKRWRGWSLSAAERAVLAESRRPAGRRAFLVAWTRKEAMTKATGDRLRAAFSNVVVAADGGRPGVSSPYPRSPRACSCSTWTWPPGTWRRWRSSAAARRCGPGTGRRCWRAWPEPGKPGKPESPARPERPERPARTPPGAPGRGADELVAWPTEALDANRLVRDVSDRHPVPDTGKAVVTPSASCASIVREYFPVLATEANDPGLARAVAEVAPQTYELSVSLATCWG